MPITTLLPLMTLGLQSLTAWLPVHRPMVLSPTPIHGRLINNMHSDTLPKRTAARAPTPLCSMPGQTFVLTLTWTWCHYSLCACPPSPQPYAHMQKQMPNSTPCTHMQRQRQCACTHARMPNHAHAASNDKGKFVFVFMYACHPHHYHLVLQPRSLDWGGDGTPWCVDHHCSKV